MKSHHMRHHWTWAAAVAALALLSWSEAHGQSTGAQAVYEGRPAMAGAQAGTGAMAGPPQGGLGVQGTTPAVQLRAPAAVPPPPASAETAPAVQAGDRERLAPRERKVPRDSQAVPRERDSGVAKPQRSATEKTRRAAKRTRDATRHGVSPIDSR